jgi:hypothetical protein
VERRAQQQRVPAGGIGASNSRRSYCHGRRVGTRRVAIVRWAAATVPRCDAHGVLGPG